jgi:hypothetical protein
MALCYARLAQHVSDTTKKRKLHLDAALAYIRASDSLPEDDLDHVCTYCNAVDFFQLIMALDRVLRSCGRLSEN